MFWQVENGGMVSLYNSYQDYPHKEAWIDFSGWTWKNDGNYQLKLTARDYNNNIVAVKNFQLKTKVEVEERPLTPSSQPTTETPQAATLSVNIGDHNPLSGLNFFIPSNSPLKNQASAWRTSRPNEARLLEKLASQPLSVWLGGWNPDVKSDVERTISEAGQKGQVPVFVLYNIPERDCGNYSSGGMGKVEDYLKWVGQIAEGAKAQKAIFIVEPDALALTDCLSSENKLLRFQALKKTVELLKTQTKGVVYLDAGHSGWINDADMTERLKQAGIAAADGFALNVSNYKTTTDNINYGTLISNSIEGKHFVIDTSRNGQGPNWNLEWCNPSGRGVGAKPTNTTGNRLVDAFLWVKDPGSSDGYCNGGPSAGTFWPENALGLSERASW